MLIMSALTCLALNIYHEARSEPPLGQFAVAMVTMNRAQSQSKICDTVMAKGQFSWTAKMVSGRAKDGSLILNKAGQPLEAVAWEQSKAVALKAIKSYNLKSMDVTNGATFYHSKAVRPNWHKHAEITAIIGQHIFYRLRNKSVMTG